MKVQELIKKLQELYEQYGDLPIFLELIDSQEDKNRSYHGITIRPPYFTLFYEKKFDENNIPKTIEHDVILLSDNVSFYEIFSN